MKTWPTILCSLITSLAFLEIASADSLPPADEDYGPNWDQPKDAQGAIAKNMEDWVRGFERVEIVLFNYKEDENRRLVESGIMHRGVIREFTKRLSNKDISLLSKAVTGKHPSRGGGFCGFRPHHGFIFYGKDDKILGHIEICFLCSDYYSMPREGLSQEWDINGLRTLVTSLGLPILKNDKEWEDFFATKRHKQSSPKR